MIIFVVIIVIIVIVIILTPLQLETRFWGHITWI